MNARDPVCGMEVDVASPRGGQTEFAGMDYRFCGPTCRDRFLADPVRFASVSRPVAAPHLHRGTTYTCPMHPAIIRETPNCPICNLALEPRLTGRPA